MSCATGSREDAIRALINFWIKDPALSCGFCGTSFTATEPCCEKPFIANNADILKQFIKENSERRQEQRNKYASNKDKTFRNLISMPPSLLLFLEASFERLYKEKLFNEEYPATWFHKHFGKYFSVAEEC